MLFSLPNFSAGRQLSNVMSTFIAKLSHFISAQEMGLVTFSPFFYSIASFLVRLRAFLFCLLTYKSYISNTNAVFIRYNTIEWRKPDYLLILQDNNHQDGVVWIFSFVLFDLDVGVFIRNPDIACRFEQMDLYIPRKSLYFSVPDLGG